MCQLVKKHCSISIHCRTSKDWPYHFKHASFVLVRPFPLSQFDQPKKSLTQLLVQINSVLMHKTINESQRDQHVIIFVYRLYHFLISFDWAFKWLDIKTFALVLNSMSTHQVLMRHNLFFFFVLWRRVVVICYTVVGLRPCEIMLGPSFNFS